LAPECLADAHSFTSSSDVWAFAVLLWEMFSGGSHPWAGMSGDQVCDVIFFFKLSVS